LRIRVCIARAGVVQQVLLELETGATAGQAAQASGLVTADWPGAIGIHGVTVDAGQLLADGDRVELYQPLAVDPRTRRRARAARRR